jgi:single-strand DNA-binding protein
VAVSLNRCEIIGFLSKEPEVRYTTNGIPVANFSVATNRTFKDSEGKVKEETEWFNVVVFGKTAENCKSFLDKGSRVYVGGHLHTRSWQSPDGMKHARTELVSENIIFLTHKQNYVRQEAEVSVTEEIPF